MRALIDDALGKGARLVAGGEVSGTVMAATVLDRVTPAMRVYGEESFGPLVGIVLRAKDDDDAVRIANDTEYGLAAAVFGRDVDARARGREAYRVRCLSRQRRRPCMTSRRFRSAAPSRPAMVVSAASAAIDEFTELRTITIANGPQKYPF